MEKESKTEHTPQGWSIEVDKDRNTIYLREAGKVIEMLTYLCEEDLKRAELFCIAPDLKRENEELRTACLLVIRKIEGIHDIVTDDVVSILKKALHEKR